MPARSSCEMHPAAATIVRRTVAALQYQVRDAARSEARRLYAQRAGGRQVAQRRGQTPQQRVGPETQNRRIDSRRGKPEWDPVAAARAMTPRRGGISLISC